MKIIWNITKKCGYSCDICATYSERKELTKIEKAKALNSLLSLNKDYIKELDFSGGDPLSDSESISIIYEAIRKLGKDKISITTTGRGIINAIEMKEDLSKLLYNCELTIDSVGDVLDYLRGDVSYVPSNRSAISEVSTYIHKLTINVPIINPRMSEQDIKHLVNAIESIKVDNIHVNLIRLMNVGRMNAHPNSDDYSPVFFIQTFMKYASNSCIKNIHVNCALRGRLYNSKCNMLIDKVGIDCAGNVFACAWGGYIDGFSPDRITENPFYLGNLLNGTLVEILAGVKANCLKDSISNKPTAHCRVYCYDYSSAHDIFDNKDPLLSSES